MVFGGGKISRPVPPRPVVFPGGGKKTCPVLTERLVSGTEVRLLSQKFEGAGDTHAYA